MLPKENRLTKEKDFRAVFQKGKSIKSGFLVFRFLKNNLGQSRFGFIVSKKVSNKATARNRVKRMLRGSVEGQFEKLKLSFDIVVLALPEITEKEFDEIKGAVAEFFKKINSSVA